MPLLVVILLFLLLFLLKVEREKRHYREQVRSFPSIENVEGEVTRIKLRNLGPGHMINCTVICAWTLQDDQEKHTCIQQIPMIGQNQSLLIDAIQGDFVEGQADLNRGGISQCSFQIEYDTQASERIQYFYDQAKNQNSLTIKHSMNLIKWFGNKQLISTEYHPLEKVKAPE
ncbi:hypothetical protein ACQCN2_02005 [Brevibacillus ginsengisoli]|uniref:hypothetical protein n=1 Tax=Brevibacillus ginsengisoli TaxID=363854 RepID=UPI003CE6A02D